MGREIFIHCGLHKTGTTALQNVFFLNARELFQQGFLYPKAFIPPKLTGHHNLAWELSRDRRYRIGNGNTNLLSQKMAEHRSEIILSSEDFEGSLLHPERWTDLKVASEQAGRTLVFVVYLRDQLEYFESLYGELLWAGCGDEFSTIASRIIESRKICFKEWEFCFDFSSIGCALQQIDGARVIFRDYNAMREACTIKDFSSVVGIDCGKINLNVAANKANGRKSLDFLMKLFIRNRLGAINQEIANLIEELCHGVDGLIRAPTYIKKMFLDHEDFRRDRLKFQLCSPKSHAYQHSTLNAERVFSFRTQLAVLELLEHREHAHTRSVLMQMWRNWISETGMQNT